MGRDAYYRNTVTAKKAHAGSLGGRVTVARYGKAHMAEIGRRGAATLWRRYHLTPAGLNGWALIRKKDNQVIATW